MTTKAIMEFDAETRTFHLSATERIHVSTEEQLNTLCWAVTEAVSQHAATSRCFLLVDISKIAIEPDLAQLYAEKIKKLGQKYLYPEGLVRYGSEITRVTARIGHDLFQLEAPHLFRTKAEALKYIGELRATYRRPASADVPPGGTLDGSSR